MGRRFAIGVLAVLAGAACHRQPKPTLEWGETVTYTSTAADPVPQATTPVAAPAAQAPLPAAADTEAPPPAEPVSPSASPAPEPAEGEWTTTVDTADEPAAAAPPENPAPARQWYKAKSW